jgi:hypothetical protein
VHPGRWVIRPASIASAGCPGASVATVCSSVMVRPFYVRGCPECIDGEWVAVGDSAECSTSHQAVGFSASRLWKPARAVTDASLSKSTAGGVAARPPSCADPRR